MSKQSVYTVHSGDECGGDPCYNVLKGPAGFECWLTEPEDRSFWRDLAPVVERLEHLEQSNAQLREQNRVLRGLVVHVEQIEADLHAALNGTRHDPSWIRPIQLSRNERQELYLGCIKDLQALKAALAATSQEGQG